MFPVPAQLTVAAVLLPISRLLTAFFTLYLHTTTSQIEKKISEVQIDRSTEIVPSESWRVVHEQERNHNRQETQKYPEKSTSDQCSFIIVLVTILIVFFLQMRLDLFFERYPTDFEEDRGDSPDEQIKKSVGFEVSEERSREDMEHRIVYSYPMY